MPLDLDQMREDLAGPKGPRLRKEYEDWGHLAPGIWANLYWRAKAQAPVPPRPWWSFWWRW